MNAGRDDLTAPGNGNRHGDRRIGTRRDRSHADGNRHFVAVVVIEDQNRGLKLSADRVRQIEPPHCSCLMVNAPRRVAICPGACRWSKHNPRASITSSSSSGDAWPMKSPSLPSSTVFTCQVDAQELDAGMSTCCRLNSPDGMRLTCARCSSDKTRLPCPPGFIDPTAVNQGLPNVGRTRSPGGSGHETEDGQPALLGRSTATHRRTRSPHSSCWCLRLIDAHCGSPSRRYVNHDGRLPFKVYHRIIGAYGAA